MEQSLAYVGIATQITLLAALVWFCEARHARMLYWGKVAQLGFCLSVYLAAELNWYLLGPLYWAVLLINTMLDAAIIRSLTPRHPIFSAWAIVLVWYSYIKAVELLFSPMYAGHLLDAYYYCRQGLDIILDALYIAGVYTVSQHYRRLHSGNRTETQASPARTCRRRFQQH